MSDSIDKIAIPLISIGLPIVKTDFLDSAIQCCLNQSYKNTEVIVLNNGKTTEMRINIRLFVEKYNDKRIKYFENDTQLPIIENWNKTISLADGDLFTLLCDDDIWHQDFLSEIITLYQKYPLVKVFHTRVSIIDEKGEIKKIAPLCNEFETGIDFIWHRVKGYRTQFVSDFVADRESLLSIGGFADLPCAWGSDDITWFKLAIMNGVAYSSKPLFLYRESDINTTSTMGTKLKFKANEQYVIEVYNICIKFFKNNEVQRAEIINLLYTHLSIKNKSIFSTLLIKFGLPKFCIDFIIYSFFRVWIRFKYMHIYKSRMHFPIYN